MALIQQVKDGKFIDETTGCLLYTSKEFNMSNMHMILLKDGLSAKEKSAMSKEIEKVDGVKWVIGLNSLVGSNVPESMIPNDIKKMLKTDNYELESELTNSSS